MANLCSVQEIREIYDNSPLRNVKDKAEDHETDGNRKPVEGECPICFMEFNPNEEEIVWCRAACGNNIHKTCFQQWAATQNSQGVRCVYWYVCSLDQRELIHTDNRLP